MGIKLRNPFYFKKDKPPKEDKDDDFDIVAHLQKQIKQKRKQLELEQAQFEIDRQRRELQELRAELEDDYEDDYEDSPKNADELFYGIINKAISAKLTSHTPTQNTPPVQDSNDKAVQDVDGLTLTPEEIDNLYKKIPDGIKKRISKLNNEEIEGLIRNEIPKISNKSVSDIIVYIRNQKI